MATFNVVVTDDRFGSYREEQEVLAPLGAGLEVKNLGGPPDAIAALRHADAILVNLFPLTAQIISELEKCRVISRYGVGYDNVDVDAATRKGIWVARVPDYCHEEASDQSLALLLACVRKIAYKDRKIRQGAWNLHGDQPTGRIAGKTLGIVGYGRVGRAVHRKVGGFGLGRVLVCDPTEDPEIIRAAGARKVGLRELIEQSDFISLHVPLKPDTLHLIGRSELAQMKPGVILINCSRGPVVDEQALAEALVSGHIGGAGLDVFETEPLPVHSALRSLDNVVLSDHAGWYSEESVVELKRKAARNVAAVLGGGTPLYPVNSVSVGRPAGPEGPAAGLQEALCTRY